MENTTYHYNDRNQLYLEEITDGNHKHYYYNPNGENTGKSPDPLSPDYTVAIEEHNSSEATVSTTKMAYDDFGRMTKLEQTDTNGHDRRTPTAGPDGSGRPPR